MSNQDHPMRQIDEAALRRMEWDSTLLEIRRLQDRIARLERYHTEVARTVAMVMTGAATAVVVTLAVLITR